MTHILRKIFTKHLSLLALLVGALCIRLIAIDQSLWLDEAVVAQTVRTHSSTQLVTQFAPTDFHPPLYYLLMKAWTSVFGYSELALRMPSVLASLVTGVVIYCIVIAGSRIKPASLVGRSGMTDVGQTPRVALLSSAFFLFNPLIVYYSQEARMYMMVTLLASILLFVLREELFEENQNSKFIIQNDKEKIKKNLLITMLVAALLGTHYGSVFFLVAIGIVLVIRRCWQSIAVLAIASIISLVTLAPIVAKQLAHSQLMLDSVTNWSMVLGRAEFKNLALIPIKFVTGRYDLNTYFDYFVVFGWVVFLYGTTVVGVLKSKIKYERSKLQIKDQNIPRFSILNSEFIILTSLIIVPILLAYGVSFVAPMMQYFRYLYAIVPLSILLAASAQNRYLKSFLFVGFVAWSLVYVLNPTSHREDWKSLARSLPRLATVYMVPSAADPITYYRPDVTVKDIRTITFSKMDELIVIPYVADIHGVDLRTLQSRARVKKVDKTSFRNLSIETWHK